MSLCCYAEHCHRSSFSQPFKLAPACDMRLCTGKRGRQKRGTASLIPEHCDYCKRFAIRFATFGWKISCATAVLKGGQPEKDDVQVTPPLQKIDDCGSPQQADMNDRTYTVDLVNDIDIRHATTAGIHLQGAVLQRAGKHV